MKRGSFTSLSVMLTLMLTMTIGACAHGKSVTAAGSAISIDNFSFTPHEMKIPVGTKLTWTNHDDIPHTVVNTGQKFKSKALDTDESFAFTFDEPGIYEYFCSLHPKMVGKIIVEGKK